MMHRPDLNARVVMETTDEDFQREINAAIADLPETAIVVDMKLATCVDQKAMYYTALILWDLRRDEDDA